MITIQAMIGLARRLGLLGSGSGPASRQYSADEVRRYLAGSEVDDPGPLRQTIERLPVALGYDQSLANRYRNFERCREALPKIISLYQRGHPPARIAGEMEFLATEFAISETIRITAEIVADRLNRPDR